MKNKFKTISLISVSLFALFIAFSAHSVNTGEGSLTIVNQTNSPVTVSLAGYLNMYTPSSFDGTTIAPGSSKVWPFVFAGSSNSEAFPNACWTKKVFDPDEQIPGHTNTPRYSYSETGCFTVNIQSDSSLIASFGVIYFFDVNGSRDWLWRVKNLSGSGAISESYQGDGGRHITVNILP